MFIKVMFFFLCLNVGMGIISLANPALGWGDWGGGILSENPAFFDEDNPSNQTTLVGNLTSPVNQTDSNPFDWFIDSTARILFAGQTIINFFTMGFIVTAFNGFTTAMGIVWPDGLVEGLLVIFGGLFGLWLYYTITGRSSSGFV